MTIWIVFRIRYERRSLRRPIQANMVFCAARCSASKGDAE